MIRRLLVLAALVIGTPVSAQVPPEKSISTMKVADGLQVELFAAEPMLINPTNMDIDPLGRVWITEAVNYRTKLHKKPLNREAGDRIVILTDTDGDGKADTSTVFYQGPELYGPLGICIVPFPNKDARNGMGFRVLVSQSPDILEFTDTLGTGKADGPPKVFLTGFGGFDHDHGVHSIQVGPDGKFYFTIGDQGFKNLKSRNGKQSFSQNRTTMQGGTIWRCDPDGNNLELIAHNFRNEYEACIDSFGEIWCSDNDDDGNQQTRICHVLPGGNYGYWPRGKGESHWHEEQPGIVHKTLRTGFGSPCGITCYEGSLLPEKYRGQLLHCDAGPREVRCFHKKPKGAGYELEKSLILTSTDNWFRPVDVCTAPDGSIFVCDWYDPGVGGHGMGDTTRGRVYRITPAGHRGYQVDNPADSAESLRKTLESPNISTRSLFLKHLESMDPIDGIKYLDKKVTSLRDQTLRIRYAQLSFPYMFAINGKVDPQEGYKAGQTLGFNITSQASGIGQPTYSATYRIIRSASALVSPPDRRMMATTYFTIAYGGNDVSAAREALIWMNGLSAEMVTDFFPLLAKKYDGQDRAYLAALNIACGTDPARREAILADFDKHFPEWNDKVADLVWELRPKVMLAKLDTLLADPKLTAAQKARIIDILAGSEDPGTGKTLVALITGHQPAEVKARAIEALRIGAATKWKDLQHSKDLGNAIQALLEAKPTQIVGLQLAEAVPSCTDVGTIQKLALSAETDTPVRLEAVRVIGKLDHIKFFHMLEAMVADPVVGPAAVTAIGNYVNLKGVNSGGEESKTLLMKLMTDKSATLEQQKAAVGALAGSRAGTAFLLKLKEDGKMPEALVGTAGILLRNSPFQGERNKALILFPAKAKLDLKSLPANSELAKLTGNAGNGRKVFFASFKGEAQCMKCHTVNKEGGAIGPDLSLIGKKASRENLFESILQPSKAIADQYATWKVDVDDGRSLTGLLIAESPTEITLRDANGKDYVLPTKGLEKKRLPTSLMPDDVAKALTEQELVDLAEYLTTLQTEPAK